jgi:hypothetical protein
MALKTMHSACNNKVSSVMGLPLQVVKEQQASPKASL